MRMMASAIVACRGKILMHRRAPDRKIAPGLWAIPGGHIEPEEIRAPERTMLRELWEETGLAEALLTARGLRYAMLSPQGDELRVHIDYVIKLEDFPKITPNDEGDFFWLDPGEIPPLDMRPSMRALMRRYLAHPDDTRVCVGLLEGDRVRWLCGDTAPDAGLRAASGVMARGGGEVLLMKRALSREVAPGMWANVGGHMEPAELNDPAATAVREFQEETGTADGELRGLALRGVSLVATPKDIGLIFNYTANVERRVLPPEGEEGSFHWVRPSAVASLPMTPAMRALAEHDASGGEGVCLCVVAGDALYTRPWPGGNPPT